MPLGNFFEKNFYKLIIKTIIAESKVITCINPYDLNYFRKFSTNEKKFFLIPTEGVEKINLNKKINQKKILFFWKTIKEKGILEYIQAAKIIKKKYPGLNFFIAGPTDQSTIGQSRFNISTLKAIKNKKYVKYLGYIKIIKKSFLKWIV